MEKRDIAIIGAGTAGMSAAIYAKRAGKDVVMFEGYMPGGQIVVTPEVDNYPAMAKVSGYDFAMGLYNQATELGTEMISAQVNKVSRKDGGFLIEYDGGELKAKALIIATGAKNRKLDVANEEKLTGYGVSYCATCDGAFFKGKTVAVVGGGNTAFEDAEVLASMCGKVYLIHRREGFRAEPEKVAKVRSLPNVEFILNAKVVALKGEDKVSGVTIQDTVTGETRDLPLDGVFVAVGQTPSTDIFAGLVQRDKAGYIVAGEDCIAADGIFAAGDCRTKKVRQLVTAAADGSVAALAASEYCGQD